MKPSQHLLEFNQNLQRRVTQLEQDNQQLQAELAQLRQEYERLQQSQTRYRQLFENAPVSILFINREGYITEMNRAAEHLFGATIEQLNQQACPIFANAQLVENGTLPYMLRALAGETVIEEPTYYDSSRNFDAGKLNYGKGHYCPIRDKAGEVREIVEISPDFADLWATQQRLKQERERAATERIKLLGTIAQVANLLLRSPDYTSVLPDVARLLGEAVGSDALAVTQEIIDTATSKVAVKFVTEHSIVAISSNLGDPEYQSLGVIDEEPPSELRQTILQGQSANFLVADLPDSLWKGIFEAQDCTSLLIVPIMVQGKCWGQIGFDNCKEPRLFDEAEIAILKIAADSIAAAIERQEKDDELRRSEALYRSLFEISNEGIHRWQLDQPVSVELPVDEQVELVYRYHSVAQANDVLAKMYGLAKAEDIVGMRLSQVHPPDSAITLEIMRALCGNGWQIRNAESEEIDVNGQKRYYLNSIISFVENGCVSSGWGTQIDITQLREAQQALLAAEQARAELLKTMTTIANHLLRATDYKLILPDVLQLLGEAARADRCSLAQNITDSASGKSAVRMHAEWCRVGIQASVTHTPELESALLWEDFAELYERLIQGETVQFFGTDLLCASLRELFDSQGNKAMLMVPIMVQGEFWGVFGFDYCHEVRRFEEIDQSIFAIAVGSIAAAIERQQQEEALLQAEQVKQAALAKLSEGITKEQEKAAQLQVAELAKANDVLKKTLDTLATEPDLDCFLRQILSVIAQQMNAPACLLWLFDESLQTATLHLSYTDGQVNLPARFTADPSHPLCLHSSSWVFRTNQRQPYLLEVTTPPFTRASCAYLTRSGVKAILIVPLWLGDQLIGSFGVRLPQVRDLAPNELELVQALAHQATLALQLMQLTEQASHSAVLEERNRMAREIHDVLAQAFTGVVVQLEAAKMITPQDAPVQPLFAQAQELARAGLAEARRSVWSLRPQALENTNLRSALEQLVPTLAHKTSVQIHLQIQGADYAIAPEVETHLLRIAQEALTNALTHAQASTIVIELTFGTQVVELCVRDDGQGFDPTAVRGNGFGLVSMQERAGCINGEFTLTSQPGCGTIVLIAAPLSPQSQVPTRRT